MQTDSRGKKGGNVTSGIDTSGHSISLGTSNSRECEYECQKPAPYLYISSDISYILK